MNSFPSVRWDHRCKQTCPPGPVLFTALPSVSTQALAGGMLALPVGDRGEGTTRLVAALIILAMMTVTTFPKHLPLTWR